jgi:putative ABC transport system permease protein
MYRVLLWLAFPRRLRRVFGEDMVRLFDAQKEDVRASGGSMARLWADAIRDAVLHGTAERLEQFEDGSFALARQVRRWRWWMHAFVQDVRYALRLLVKQPGVSIVAGVTLALGIGANTAIFSAVDAVLLRPLPYPDADRLVKIWEKRLREGVFNNVVAPADFVDWSKMSSAFEAMAAFTAVTADLTGAGEPVRLFAGAVSPDFFDILRVSPVIGRSFRPEEGRVGRHRVVVLNHGLWERRFGSDPAIVGQKILLNGVPHDVIGVLPRSFEFPDRTIELWSPLAFDGATEAPTRSNHFLEVYARLKPEVSLERARADMDRLGAELSRQYPDSNQNHGAHVAPLREELTHTVRTGLLLLLGAVGFVLLIACVNVSNLLLARAASRRREMAVRAAVGASRGRLVGQSLTESLLLGVLGGAAGLLVARWGIGVIRALTPNEMPLLGIDHLGVDVRVLLFTLLLSLATALLFGILPAWHLASQDLGESLKDGGRTSGGVRRRIRLALVVGEIALASLLLFSAGLTLRSFQTLLREDTGITTDRVLTALVALPYTRYNNDEKRATAFREITRRLSTIPGVQSAGATSRLPLAAENARRGVVIEGRETTSDAPTRAHPRAIAGNYFRAMGITLASGRPFTEFDRNDSPLVVVVNETMANRYWPGTSPLGKRIRWTGIDDWREVIGVVRDVRSWGYEAPVNPEVYMPLEQYPLSSMYFVLATEGNPTAVAGAFREQLRAVDADLPLSNVRTMEQVAARSMTSRRVSMQMLTTFGVLALVLAAAGIYGVMAHLVALRTPEIGVRMTLGARPPDIMKLVIRDGLAQAFVGLGIGITAGVLLMRSFRTLLYGVHPADPLTLVAVVVILAGTAVAACLIPARRAMRVDPVQALRSS